VVDVKDVFVPKRSEEDLSFGEKVWKNFLNVIELLLSVNSNNYELL